jgi:tetratricopeptide (TPR) repeat protein
MGLRMSKSIKLAPGVRMTVSRSGVGYSVGTRGARVTKTARGRVTATTGIPGSGISYTYGLGSAHAKRPTSGQRAARPPAPGKPGLFAPAWQKAIYKAISTGGDYLRLDQVAAKYPQAQNVCASLGGLLAYQAKDLDHARTLLAGVFASGFEPAGDPFLRKLAGASVISVPVADGVTIDLPLNREAVGLALVELHQMHGDLDAAVGVVEALPPTAATGLSAAELYSLTGRHTEVISMTEGVTNEDDASALLLVLRGIALRELGYLDAAKEALTVALRARSRAAEVRHKALLERATVHAMAHRRALARKDLEKVLAEDSTYAGVAEALQALSDT